MSAILSHHGSPERFVRVSNDLARHPEMSLKAKGLMLYLLSHKNGWELSERRLADALAEGRTAIRSALEEAEKYGYLRRGEQQHAEDGNWDHAVWHTTDDPERYPIEIEECPNRPWSGFTTTGSATTDGRTTKKTRSKKTRNPEGRVDSPDVESDTPKILYDDEQTVYDLTREFALAAKANRHPIPKDGSKARDRWLTEMDRLLRLGPPGGDDDPYTPDEVRAIIDFSTTDSFWKPNVQSVPTLREQASRLLNQAGQVNGKPQTAWDGSPMDRGMKVVE